jgi:hypothetical protein
LVKSVTKTHLPRLGSHRLTKMLDAERLGFSRARTDTHYASQWRHLH